jgi:Domain of unknown function (DUF6265)
MMNPVRHIARLLWIALAFVTASPSAQTARPATQTPISVLSWMAGSWAGAAEGVEMEEHWTSPRGGCMLGLHRDVAKGRTVLFEFLRIEEQGGKLVYLASPKGAPPTPFTAVEVGPSRVVFENPTHDFPQRILYWRDGTDLVARVEGTQGTTAAHQEWRWRPAALRMD